MKKMIPTSFYYNYQGLNTEKKQITYGNGKIKAKEIEEIPLFDLLLKRAKKYNSKVVSVNVIAFTPLEFEIMEE